MNDTLGLGLIGCGAFGQFLLDANEGLPGLQLVAVADADVELAQQAAMRRGVTWCATSEDLVRAEGVDVVAVATPPWSHAQLTLLALHAGRHVFCEKPLATTLQDATRVREATEATARILVVDHILRHNPLVLLLHQVAAMITKQGPLLGQARRYLFENDATDENLPPDHWFWDHTRSGGIAVEHGVHFFDEARELLGSDPQQVQAIQTRGANGNIDTVAITARHPDGVIASYYHSFTHARRCERQHTRVDYRWAEARIEGWIPLSLELDCWTDDEGRTALLSLLNNPDQQMHVMVTAHTRPSVDAGASAGGERRQAPHHVVVVAELDHGTRTKEKVYAAGVRAGLRDLCQAVRNNDEPVAGVESGWRSIAVASAAQQAADDGRVVDVPTNFRGLEMHDVTDRS